MSNPSAGPPNVPVQQLISRAYLQWSYPVRYFDSWDAWKKGSGGGNSLPDHAFLTDTHFYVVKSINSECYRCVALDYIHTIWVRVQSGLMSERCTVVVSCTPAQHDILFDLKGKDLGPALHAALIKYGGRPETALKVVKTDLWKESSIQLSPMHGYQLVWAPPSRRQDVMRYTIRLIRFYEHHCPEKLANIDAILEAGEGHEETIFTKLVAKYGPEPPPLDYPTRLRRFYTKYCPDKIGSINSILEKARGAEELIFSKLRAKYGQEPVEVDYTNVPDEALVTKIKEFFLKRDPPKAEDQPACRKLAREYKNNEAALWAELERRCGPALPSFSEYGEGDVMEIEPTAELEVEAVEETEIAPPASATTRQVAAPRTVDQRPTATAAVARASEREVGAVAPAVSYVEPQSFSSGPSPAVGAPISEKESFSAPEINGAANPMSPAMDSQPTYTFTSPASTHGSATQVLGVAEAWQSPTQPNDSYPGPAPPVVSDRKPLRKPPPSIYFGKGRPETVRILEGARQSDGSTSSQVASASSGAQQERLTRKPTYVSAGGIDVDGKGSQDAPGSYLKVGVEDRLLFGGGEAIRRIRSQKRGGTSYSGSPSNYAMNPHFETADADGYDWEVPLDPSSDAAVREYRQRLLDEDPGVAVLRGSELLPRDADGASSPSTAATTKSLAAAETLKVQLKKELEEDDYFGLKKVLDLSPKRGLVFGAGVSRRRATATADPAGETSSGGLATGDPTTSSVDARIAPRSSTKSETVFGRGRPTNAPLFAFAANETQGSLEGTASPSSSQYHPDRAAAPRRWLQDDERRNPLSPTTPTQSLVQQMKWRALDSALATRPEPTTSYGWAPASASKSTAAAAKAKANPADPSKFFPHSARSANRSMAFLKEADMRYEERLEELGRNPLAVPTLTDVLQHTERLSKTWQHTNPVGEYGGFRIQPEAGEMQLDSLHPLSLNTSNRSLSSTTSSPSPTRPYPDRDYLNSQSNVDRLLRDPTLPAKVQTSSLSVLEPLEFGSALL